MSYLVWFLFWFFTSTAVSFSMHSAHLSHPLSGGQGGSWSHFHQCWFQFSGYFRFECAYTASNIYILSGHLGHSFSGGGGCLVTFRSVFYLIWWLLWFFTSTALSFSMHSGHLSHPFLRGTGGPLGIFPLVLVSIWRLF